MSAACDTVKNCAQTLSDSIQPADAPFAPSFEEQLAVCLEEKIPLISFTRFA